MSKFLTRIHVVFLVCVLLLIACSNENGTQNNTDSNQTGQKEEQRQDKGGDVFKPEGYPIVSEKITLTMFGPKSAVHSDWDKMDFFKIMEERTNIHFDFDTPPAGDAFQEKKNLLVASGELPDVLFGASLTSADEVNYGSQGIIIPLEELIEKYAPNLASILEDPVIKGSITATDGHIYTLPQLTETYLNYPKLWYNQVWLDKLGLPVPTTVDELYNVLVAFKEKDPNGNGVADEIPLTDYTGVSNVKLSLLAAFGLLNGYFGEEVGVENDKAFFAPIDERYKAYLEFMNRLYSEGILDQEAFSQTVQQWVAKGHEGKYGVFSNAGPFLTVGTEANDDYPALPPLTSLVNDKQLQLKTPTIIRGAFAITSSNPYPEATIRWVDQLYTFDDALLISDGVKGVHWKEAESGGIEHLIPEGVEQETWRGSFTPDPGTVTPKDYRKVFEWISSHEEQTHPLNWHITEETNTKLKPYAQIGYPQVFFTNEEQQQLNVMSADIRTYVKEMEAKFITGNTSFNEWDSYVNTLKQMKVEDLVMIYQQAYDRWKIAQ